MNRCSSSFIACLLAATWHTQCAAQDMILSDSFDGLTCGAGARVVATLGAAYQPTRLGTVVQFPIEVRSCDYPGAVSLQLSGVPTSWTAMLEDPNFAIAPGETVYGSLTVTVPGNGEAGTRAIGLTVAAGNAGNLTFFATLDVANEYVVTIVPGATLGAYGFPPVLNLRVGARLTIRNGDSQFHRMHFGGGIGIDHEDPPGSPPGGEYSGVVQNAGMDAVYCHDHGSSVQPEMRVFASN